MLLFVRPAVPISLFSGAGVKRNSFEAIRPIAADVGQQSAASRGAVLHIAVCFLYISLPVSCTHHYLFPVHITTCFLYMSLCVSCT